LPFKSRLSGPVAGLRSILAPALGLVVVLGLALAPAMAAPEAADDASPPADMAKGHVAAAGRATPVPPGNRSPVQPEISLSAVKRTAETRGNFDAKYRTIYAALAADKTLIDKIRAAAAAYDIDPIHIIGAIVGEHTYNVDAFDTLQSYYIKAIEYFRSSALRFAYKGEPIETFVARPQFAACADAQSDYALWTCRERVWETTFRGKTVDGVAFPDSRFGRTFFQPFFAGQTFGLGQLNPLTALMMSDVVHATSGLPVLDMRRAPEVYRAVMNPDMTLQYMAAIIRHDIDIYRTVAGFDISGNPGITATLYNVGDADARAHALAAANRERRAAGHALKLPVENYYGWLVNDRLDELRKLLAPAE
jgi:hypothetical protein